MKLKRKRERSLWGELEGSKEKRGVGGCISKERAEGWREVAARGCQREREEEVSGGKHEALRGGQPLEEVDPARMGQSSSLAFN